MSSGQHGKRWRATGSLSMQTLKLADYQSIVDKSFYISAALFLNQPEQFIYGPTNYLLPCMESLEEYMAMSQNWRWKGDCLPNRIFFLCESVSVGKTLQTLFVTVGTIVKDPINKIPFKSSHTRSKDQQHGQDQDNLGFGPYKRYRKECLHRLYPRVLCSAITEGMTEKPRRRLLRSCVLITSWKKRWDDFKHPFQKIERIWLQPDMMTICRLYRGNLVLVAWYRIMNIMYCLWRKEHGMVCGCRLARGIDILAQFFRGDFISIPADWAVLS